MALLVDEGIRYPFRGDRSTDLLTAGGVLGLVAAITLQLAAATYPSLLAPVFVVLAAVTAVALLGYLLRVFETTVRGDDAPPSFRSIDALVRDGCRLGVVSLAYAIGPAVLLAVTVGGLVRVRLSPEAIGFVGATALFAASTIVLVLVVAFGYGFPAAVGRLAEGDRLRAALDPCGQRSILTHGGYFTAWTFAALFAVPGWAFLLAALSRPSPFGVAAVFVTFYTHVVATRLVARGYRSAAAKAGDR